LTRVGKRIDSETIPLKFVRNKTSYLYGKRTQTRQRGEKIQSHPSPTQSLLVRNQRLRSEVWDRRLWSHGAGHQTRLARQKLSAQVREVGKKQKRPTINNKTCCISKEQGSSPGPQAGSRNTIHEKPPRCGTKKCGSFSPHRARKKVFQASGREKLGGELNLLIQQV